MGKTVSLQEYLRKYSNPYDSKFLCFVNDISVYNCFCPPIVYLALKKRLDFENRIFNPLQPMNPINPEGVMRDYFCALGRIANNIESSPFETLEGCIDLWEVLGPETYKDFLFLEREFNPEMSNDTTNICVRELFKGCVFYKVHKNWAPFGIKIPAIIARKEDLQFNDGEKVNLINKFQLEPLYVGKTGTPKTMLIQSFSHPHDFLQDDTVGMPEFGFRNPFAEAVQGKITKKTRQNIADMKQNLELVLSKMKKVTGENGGIEEKKSGPISGDIWPKISAWDQLCLGKGAFGGTTIYIAEKNKKGRDYTFIELGLGDKRKNAAAQPSKRWDAIFYYAFNEGKAENFSKIDLLRANKEMKRLFPNVQKPPNAFPLAKSGIKIIVRDALHRQTVRYNPNYSGKTRSECAEQAENMQDCIGNDAEIEGEND